MLTNWLVVLAVAVYLHLIYAFRHTRPAARRQVEFLRRFAARDSDGIVLFWAIGASLAAVILFFLPFSPEDPRSIFTVLVNRVSGKSSGAFPSVATKSAHTSTRLLGWWIVPLAAGAYLHVVWSYRRYFVWAEAQTNAIRRVFRSSSDHVVLLLGLVLDVIGIVLFVLGVRTR